MEILELDQIREATDLADQHEVEVPEWGAGVGVVVRGLSRAEVQRATRAATVDGEVDQAALDIEVFALAVVKPELPRETWAEICASKSFKAIERIAQAIAEISGMLPGAVKEAERSFRSGA